jgi:hypothetical protein
VKKTEHTKQQHHTAQKYLKIKTLKVIKIVKQQVTISLAIMSSCFLSISEGCECLTEVILQLSSIKYKLAQNWSKRLLVWYWGLDFPRNVEKNVRITHKF